MEPSSFRRAKAPVRSIDVSGHKPYFGRVQTTVEIDDAILRQAEQQARQQGKSLAALMEDALRRVIQSPRSGPQGTPSETADGLEDNDPFFTALDEIRSQGRFPAPHRAVDLD